MSEFMNILFIGDLFGNDSVTYLEKNLQRIKQENKINIVIANAENVTNGKGLAERHYNRLKKLGISCFTMGNHTFSNNEIFSYIDNSLVIRPANINTNIGKGYYVINYNGKKICVINLMGRVFMNMSLDCPFRALDNILASVKADYYIVDMHAEASSEKIALGYDFDGKVSAVVGTHTHVQTADERVLPNGTLFITDIGMTGPLNGVIGSDAAAIIERFRTGVFNKAMVSTGDFQFNAVVLSIGDSKPSIKRIHEVCKNFN
jgi:metallophosphoesterase (TIGR00282 family)